MLRDLFPGQLNKSRIDGILFQSLCRLSELLFLFLGSQSQEILLKFLPPGAHGDLLRDRLKDRPALEQQRQPLKMLHCAQIADSQLRLLAAVCQDQPVIL